MWLDKRSKIVYDELHPDLQTLVDRVHEVMPLKLICGFRNEADQNKAFEMGLSKVQWPDSKHNKLPSLAVDVSPDPIDWDRERLTYMAGMIMALAYFLSIPLLWGGDWSNDTVLKDNAFDDLVHFELI